MSASTIPPQPDATPRPNGTTTPRLTLPDAAHPAAAARSHPPPGAAPGAGESPEDTLHQLSTRLTTAQSFPPGAPREAAIAALIEAFDSLYWRLLEARPIDRGTDAIGPDAVGINGAANNQNRRLLLDAGIFQPYLVSPGVIAHIEAEWIGSSAETVWYPTEWFQERIRHHQTDFAADMPKTSAASGATQSDGTRIARVRLISALENCFSGLPDVSHELAARFRTGRLDQSLLAISARLARQGGGTRADFLLRHRLKKLRDDLFAKLRHTTRNPEDHKRLDALRDLYRKEWISHKQLAGLLSPDRADDSRLPAPRAGMHARSLDQALAEDIDTLRESAERAARLGGEERASPFYRAKQPRVTRQCVGPVLSLALDLWRHDFPAPPALLLPICGRGACAWKLNALVVAQRPTVNVEDAVATAFGDWLLQIDQRRNNGEMASAFARHIGGTDFANDFINGYRQWLCRVAKGDADALPFEWRAFFREQVGPPLDGPIVPAKFRQLSPHGRFSLRERIQRQIDAQTVNSNLYRRYAVLCWQDDLIDLSILHFKNALRGNSRDSEAALSLGLVFLNNGQRKQAAAMFQLGAERGLPSLWTVYCRDLLREM